MVAKRGLPWFGSDLYSLFGSLNNAWFLDYVLIVNHHLV